MVKKCNEFVCMALECILISLVSRPMLRRIKPYTPYDDDDCDDESTFQHDSVKTNTEHIEPRT